MTGRPNEPPVRRLEFTASLKSSMAAVWESCTRNSKLAQSIPEELRGLAKRLARWNALLLDATTPIRRRPTWTGFDLSAANGKHDLFKAKCHQGIHTRGTPRRDIAGQDRHRRQDHRNAAEHHGIM